MAGRKGSAGLRRTVLAVPPAMGYPAPMGLLVNIGVGITLLGLVGLGFCIRKAATIRGLKGDPDAQRAQMHQLVALNLASVGVASLGLGIVVVGLIL